MSSGRFLGGLLIGGALGTIIGMLIAPRSGEETREMIREEFTDRVNRSVDTVKFKAAELRELTREKMEALEERGNKLAEDLEETGRETWEKVRTVVKSRKDTPEEPLN